MNELEVVDKIRWFMTLPEARPGVPWDKDFEERSYIRWACEELIHDIMDRPCASVETTIDTFWFRMLQYFHFATSPKMSKVFRVAMDTADTIKAMI